MEWMDHQVKLIVLFDHIILKYMFLIKLKELKENLVSLVNQESQVKMEKMENQENLVNVERRVKRENVENVEKLVKKGNEEKMVKKGLLVHKDLLAKQAHQV